MIKEMTAKEMFETLGYKLALPYNSKNENYAYLYIKDYGNKYHEIRFMFRDKIVQCSKIFYDDKKMWSLSIDIETQKAITQQMKELGWLK